MTIDLTDPILHDEAKAREWLESARWPTGPFCPHCGSFAVTRMGGEKHRAGLFYCPDCRGQFTVLTGSVMERSHIPLPKWAMAIKLMTASKKGVSAHQLHRMLDLTYKTAWFMAHRIREAMAEENPPPLGGTGKVVEADEMYHGKRETPRQRNKYLPPPTKRGLGGPAQKREILGLVERGGEGRMIHMDRITAKNLREKVVRLADRKSKLHTDESRLYDSLGYEFKAHEAVHHAKGEYARGKGPDLVTTNTVEGMFGIFQRGMTGVYQHCREQHLQRYLNEFSFRYSHRMKLGIDDDERAAIATRAMNGKRLTYRQVNAA